MLAGAFYNEIDPFAAATLRELIKAGHIAPGVVDERSIEDIKPRDLNGFSQCHFFAGIGVWSYALRRAGWPDDRPVWTGSCPCQPFSAAGQGTGFDDKRHLWPHFHWLIQERKPASVLGEQVASKDADPWIDLVQTDLEALGFAFGAVAFPSAGVGAPHIRDRTYWVATRADRRGMVPAGNVRLVGMAHAAGQQRPRSAKGSQPRGRALSWPGRDLGALEHTRHNHDAGEGQAAGAWQSQADRPANLAGGPGVSSCELVNAEGLGRQRGSLRAGAGMQAHGTEEAGLSGRRTSPTNGPWRDADWLLCRDGKWRPVEPGTFPLAHGTPARVGRLRGYGNAINAYQAQIFIEATLKATP